MVKLIIGGSTGFVGTEIIRQALANPAIQSIVGLSRRQTVAPEGSPNTHKLRSVIVDDFENYSESTKKELEDADACIWTIAVTPSRAREIPWDETVKICRDYALTAIRTVAAATRRQSEPLRFIYISGHFTLRKGDEAIKQLKDHGLVEMALMRGELEDTILEYGNQSNGKIQALIAKPGFIAAPGRDPPPVPGLPNLQLRDIAAALLDQAINGFEKNILSNDELTDIGQKDLGN